MKSTYLFAAALVAVVFAFGTAFAMEHGGYWRHRPAFGLFSPKMVEQLHLNPDQTRSLDAIKAERKLLFSQVREQHQAMMAAWEKALRGPNPDLRVLVQQRNAAMDVIREKMRKIQGDELELYASLSAQQKSLVRNSLLKHLSFMEKHQGWKHRHPVPPVPGHGSVTRI